MPDAFVIVRIVPAGARAAVVRAFALTPYDLELLAAEVHRYGAGSRLEVTVGGDEADVSEVAAALAPSRARAVDLRVTAMPKEVARVPSASCGR